MTWSADGKTLFLAEKTGVVRRIKADGLIEDVRVDLKAPCSWLSLSAEGLLVAVAATGNVRILDPDTLKSKGSIPVPSSERVISSPRTSLAFAVGGKGEGASLSIIDVKKKAILRQYGPRDIPGTYADFKNPALTPDGKFLFIEGSEQLQRYRVRDGEIEHQESSERIAQNGQSIVISPDGFYVALPSGGGNYGGKPYSTRIYKITNLSTPAITVQSGAYPQTLGFDMKAGLIYAQNHQFPLIVFLPTGLKQRESKLGFRGSPSVKQFLVYPEGRKLLVLTEANLALVELPRDDE